jgi:tRNA dimethylallyltransferase
MPLLCALVGATGVGKTKLSLSLAKELRAEIISMDSRQIYRDFCIGTAQPSKDALRTIPHHLVDFYPPTESFSVGEFVREVKTLLRKNPEISYILVGGTGMYLQALTEGLAEIPPVSEDVRERCEKMLAEEGLESLFKKVQEVDPDSAQTILPQDRQRLLRALEVSMQTGRKFSEIRNDRKGGVGRVKTFWLDRERTTLYANIDKRVLQMVEDGWKEEVEALLERVPLDAPAWQSLGYKEWISCIQGKMSEKEVIETVQQGTRRYAKRQITWFRHQTVAERVDLDIPFDESFAKIVSALTK